MWIKNVVAYILMLEQFRRPEKQRRGLLRSKRLSDVKEVDDTSQKCSTLSRTNWRFIEHARLLDDGCFVVVVRTEAAFVLLFGRE